MLVTFSPDWNSWGHVADMEIETIKLAYAPNPIAETGYKSHFLPLKEVENGEELQAYILAWLTAAAKKSAWKAHVQLSLF